MDRENTENPSFNEREIFSSFFMVYIADERNVNAKQCIVNETVKFLTWIC